MRRFLRGWLAASAATWLARAFLLSVGIEAMEGIHGWARVIPAVLGGALLVVIVREEIRKRRSPVAP
jgi:hypothetical protein